jgi:hypothetical protein
VDDLAAGDEEIALKAKRPRALQALRSTVYRLEPAGRAVPIWSSPDEAIHCLIAGDSGRIYFGTGVPGRLYGMEADEEVPRLLLRFAESQVTSLAAGDDGLLYALTSNQGKLFRATEKFGSSGSFLSPIRDVGSRARWGRVAWDADSPAGTRVEVSTRSGNSSRPDETWSEWSPPYIGSEGAQVVSPAARYLQLRARLSRLGEATSPVVRSVSLSFREDNLAPQVGALHLEARSGEDSEGPPPRRRKIVWTATDPNDDSLSHDLDLQVEGETAWSPLARDLSTAEHTWDTGAVPGGRYRLRVQTTDAPDNGIDHALTASSMSRRFVIDHEPPEVEVVSGARPGTIALRVTDAVSPVVRVEISGAGLPMQRLRPVDGLDDSRDERYEVELADLSPGSHALHVVAYDREGNRRKTTVPAEVKR